MFRICTATVPAAADSTACSRGDDMKTMAAIIGLALVGTAASAQSSHAVSGYTRSDGTYVAPHMQTNANSTKLDNWSTQGNVNPYTGREGTVDPYAPTSRNPYGSPNNDGYGHRPH